MEQTYYFTYGVEGHDYYGGWTEVVAESKDAAIKAFSVYHPLKDGFVPCGWIYTEEEFKKTTMYENGNFGFRCYEKIELRRFILKGANNND